MYHYENTSIEKVELEGEFVIGSKGTIYMTGMPPLPFTLDEIIKNKKYTVTSQFGDVTVFHK